MPLVHVLMNVPYARASARPSGTLTRVISDDKGTSMLIAFEQAQLAVAAALEIKESIFSIPTCPDRVRKNPFLPCTAVHCPFPLSQTVPITLALALQVHGSFSTAMGITTGDVWIGRVGAWSGTLIRDTGCC